MLAVLGVKKEIPDHASQNSHPDRLVCLFRLEFQ